jgi:glycosyltransferase involved in cell wall biosynthesis
MKKLISVIVPVYNSKETLAECVSSILNQDYGNIELIIVDDGSSDGSGRSCDLLAKKDGRVKVFHIDNAGVSNARNFGIKKAKGYYITFVDSDDWIDPDMFSKMTDKLESNNADFIWVSYINEFEKKSVYKRPWSKSIETFDKEGVLKLHAQLFGPINEELSNVVTRGASHSPCARIIKKSILEEKNICFKDYREIGYGEDFLFNLDILANINCAVYWDKHFYHYRRYTNESLTKKYNPALREQAECFYKILEDHIVKNGLDAEYYQRLESNRALSVLTQMKNVLRKNGSAMEIRKEDKEVLNDRKFKDDLMNLDIENLPLYLRLFYNFCRKRMALCVCTMVWIADVIKK